MINAILVDGLKTAKSVGRRRAPKAESNHHSSDLIDEQLRERKSLFFPSRTLYKGGLKAFSITSFGFGQKGAQAIGLHSRYMFAAATEGEYHDYCVRVRERQQRASQAWAKAVAMQTVCDVKDLPPWGKGNESAVMLDPLARF